jgi:type IX secretion system PorP/SprF family membrane protein
MKTLLLTGISLLCSLAAVAQSKIDITQFSLIQQYYNPSLTGNQGSVMRALYRNQWTGFEDAPKTIFVSGEFSLSDLSASKASAVRRSTNPGAENALGLSVLHDSFGPYSETQVYLSYGSAIRLSESLNLRWGSALSYKSNRLDGNKLIVDQDDPKHQHLLNHNNRKSRIDMNLGIALSSGNYYFAYALQDAARNGFIRTGDDFMEESYSRKHVLQAGYRTSLSKQFGLVVNGLYLYDKLHKETAEVQLKGVYDNMLWAGAGYRKDLAFNFTAGVRLNQLQLGYAYEMPAGDASAIPNNTNEIVISYRLYDSHAAGKGNQLLIW